LVDSHKILQLGTDWKLGFVEKKKKRKCGFRVYHYFICSNVPSNNHMGKFWIKMCTFCVGKASLCATWVHYDWLIPIIFLIENLGTELEGFFFFFGTETITWAKLSGSAFHTYLTTYLVATTKVLHLFFLTYLVPTH